MSQRALGFLLICLLSTAAWAAEKPLLISGLDDVLRQAENVSLRGEVRKLLAEDKSFTGMPELYRALAGDEKIVVLTGMSKWFHERIEKFLRDFQYPEIRLIMRSWLTEWSIVDYKSEHFKSILADSSRRKALVILDDSDASIDVAKKLKKEMPERILAVYVHSVARTSLPAEAVPYFTAFDVALNEYRKERLTVDQVLKVGQAVLNEKDPQNLFPTYAHCPKDHNPCYGLSGPVLKSCEQVREKVQGICKAR